MENVSVCSAATEVTATESSNSSSSSEDPLRPHRQLEQQQHPAKKSSFKQQQHPEAVILDRHQHHCSSSHHLPLAIMTLDVEEPFKTKPQRKDAIDEFHKKIIHEDTERGDHKITINSSAHHGHPSQQLQQQPQPQQSQQMPPPPPAPMSRGSSGLPLTMCKSAAAAANSHEPRLIPRSLRIIPLHVRFALNGLLSNVLFTVAYNWAVTRSSATATTAGSSSDPAAAAATNDSSSSSFWSFHFSNLSPSAIYSILYLIFIPVGHAMACIFVFGWPERYLPSLLSNCPIGLCAIVLGATLTAYLDSIQFNEMVAEYIRNNYTFTEMPQREPQAHGEFYSSLVVVFVTNLWTYLSSLYVNSPPQKSEKKEL